MKWTKRGVSWALELDCVEYDRWHPHARIYPINSVSESVAATVAKYKYAALIWPECHTNTYSVEVGYNTIKEAKRDVERIFTT